MSDFPPVRRGTRELRRLLRHAVELRGLGLGDFRLWLTHQLAAWQSDSIFAQRVKMRDLRRAEPRLHELERALKRATSADGASSQSTRLHALEEELLRTGKAVSGLEAALTGAEPEKRPALQHKLDTFQARREALSEEQTRLTQASPERQELLRRQTELRQLREHIGLEAEEARLAELLSHQGRHSGQTGEAFEALAQRLTWHLLVPELRGRTDAKRLRVLRGVTLGAARTEIDQLVIRLPAHAGKPVEVLALVEVKRNLNDVAHGFRLRQENLAWLRGDTEHYESAEYRTGYFRSGHFDREAVHEEDGERFVFTRESFRRFRREPGTGPYLRRLYFITRETHLTGVSAAALARIRHRVATDEHWQPRSEAHLRELLRWCQALAEPLETPDVLRLYCAVPGLGRQVLVVSRQPRA